MITLPTKMDLVEEEILSDVDLKEKEFHGMVREVVILCLISISLYIGSFAFLGLVRRERDEVRYNMMINILSPLLQAIRSLHATLDCTGTN